MRILKRITSLLLVMAMLCSFAVFADESAAVEPAAADVEESYASAVAKLNALGFWFYSDQNDAEQVVTRGEFAYIAANLVNMADYDGETNATFRDVPTSHPYFQSIAFMYDLGVVSGEYGGLYRPDEAITYAEAMKILMCLMGYEGEAKDSGSYPSGYLFVANKIGVGVSGVSADTVLTRKICALAVADAVDVDILAKIVYGAKFVMLTSTYGKTLLTEYYDIHRAAGIVNAVGSTRATAGTKLNKSVAEIGGVAFDIGTSNVSKYIGYRVTAYYEAAENRNERSTLVYVEPVNNDTIEILGDNISDYDVSTGRLYYYKNLDNSRRSSIDFDINSDNIIYNNVRSTNLTVSQVESADRIFAVDNDRNGRYDVIFIECETVVMVKSVDAANSTIYSNYTLRDANGNAAGTALDIEDDGMMKVANITDRYGNDIDLSAIAFGTVLNVLRSTVDESGAVTTTIIVTNQTVSGAVSEIGTDASGSTVLTIDGVQYTFAKNENDITERPDVKLGNSYTFYLDLNNKIAGMGSGTSTDVYGFLVKAAYPTGMETMPEVKIFTTGGQFVTYSFSDNARINGISKFDSTDDIIRQFFNVGSSVAIDLSRSNGIIGKAVTYRVNSEGKISKMEVAKDNTSLTREEYFKLSPAENRMIKLPTGVNESFVYIRNPLIFGGIFKIASSTKIFLVPHIDAQQSSPMIKPDILKEDTLDKFDDVKNFKMGNVDSFKSYTNIKMNEASFYDFNSERVASLAVYQHEVGTDNKLSKSTGVTIVKKITEVLKEDGDTGYKLYGMKAGADVETMISTDEKTYSISTKTGSPVLSRVFVKDNTRYTQTVEPGDMIRYVTNSDDELYEYEKIFDLSDDDDPGIMLKFDYVSAVSSNLEINDDGDYVTENNSYNSDMRGMLCMVSPTDKWLDANGKGYFGVYHHSNQYYYFGAGFKFVYAEAMDIIGNTLLYKIKAGRKSGKGGAAYGDDTEEVAALSGFKITIIDTTESDLRVYKGSQSDIVPKSAYGEDGEGTKMFVYISDASPKEIIIIKNKD